MEASSACRGTMQPDRLGSPAGGAEQDVRAGAVREQTVGQSPARADDLSGDEHELVQEGAKLHAKPGIALGAVLAGAPKRERR